MRVLMVPQMPSVLYFGGAEVQAEQTASALTQLGHTIKNLESEKRFIPEIVHFFGLTVPEWVMATTSAYPTILSPIYYRSSLKEAIRAKVLNKMPGSIVRLQRKAMQLCQGILPNSRAEAQQLADHFDLDISKITVIPNGVEKEMIGEDPEGFREAYGVFLNYERYILSVQRIESRKRTIELISAALSIGVPLLIIGQFNKEHCEADYVRKVFDLALKSPHLIRIMEPLPRKILKNAYASAYVHALPSILETPGLASLEAAINGANLVVGDCPPVREYFENVAHFCEPREQGTLIHALNRAMAMPRNGMGQKEHVLSRYLWGRVAKLTEEVYSRVLERTES